MFTINSNMEQENINYLHNTKEALVIIVWGGIVSFHGSDMSFSRQSLGLFLLLSILLISCLPNVSKKTIMTQEKINFLQNT